MKVNKEKGSSPQDEKKTPTQILMEISKKIELFSNEIDDAYAVIPTGTHFELLKVAKQKFKEWLTNEYFLKTRKPVSVDVLNQVISTLKAMARFSGKEKRLYRRVAERKGAFYYDLADKDKRIVKITPNGCKILGKGPMLFERSSNMKGQVEPQFDLDGLILLAKYLRFSKRSHLILCYVYIVTCLVPNIPHPVFLVSGEKSSTKSTILKMIREVVDPLNSELLAMPTSIQDLALALSNCYMPSFDNMTGISAEKSNLLCMASTGGAISKRKLYTDDENVNIEVKPARTTHALDCWYILSCL